MKKYIMATHCVLYPIQLFSHRFFLKIIFILIGYVPKLHCRCFLYVSVCIYSDFHRKSMPFEVLKLILNENGLIGFILK